MSNMTYSVANGKSLIAYKFPQTSSSFASKKFKMIFRMRNIFFTIYFNLMYLKNVLYNN